ncbi:MAG: PAS domain S-box protein [Acidobacteriaceae bacterium]
MHSSSTSVQHDETERLKALLQHEILDTLPDPAFDEIARMAASICNAPYAFIGFLDWSRVWFKSTVGFTARHIPRNGSPCQFLLLDGKSMLVTDAASDHRFASPGIQLDNGIRCRSYAGAPLSSASGMILGTVAVCSPKPNAFDRNTLENLQVLARQIVTRMTLYASGQTQENVLRSRQRSEQALTVERNFVAAVLNTISALVLVFDTAGRIVRFNRACETISGYSFADLAGRAFPEELFPPGERETAIRMFEQVRSLNTTESFELSWHSKAGPMRRIAWTATSMTNAQDEVSFVIMTGADVTEQREAETALRESEERYRQLVESSLGFICTHDLRGVLLSINSHAARTLGYDPEELIGTRLRNHVDSDHLAEYEAYFDALQKEPDHDRQGRLYLRGKASRLCIVAYRNKRLQFPGAEPLVLSHGIDITEQTQAEEELNALTRQHESILDSVGEGILGMTMQGQVTFINRGAAKILGYSAQELQGQNLHALIHHSRADGSPYPAEECPILSSVKRETPVHVDNDVFWRKDGQSLPVEYVACPLVDNGRVDGIVVAFADVTEKRRLNRMKDEFIATVSHELRTPLTSLRAALGLVTSGALDKRPEKIPQMLDIALGNCDRLVRLVNDIVDFERIASGTLPVHKAEFNAIDLLRRAMDPERAVAARAGLSFRIDAHPVDVWVDDARIVQVLGNLIRNAIKFSEKGGEIRLAARATAEQEVTFEVQDQGAGIPPEKLELIFDKFQQADASDSRLQGGTGLGLALCRGIINQHGGRIWATSTRGQGSSFYFTVEAFPPQKDDVPRGIDGPEIALSAGNGSDVEQPADEIHDPGVGPEVQAPQQPNEVSYELAPWEGLKKPAVRAPESPVRKYAALGVTILLVVLKWSWGRK